MSTRSTLLLEHHLKELKLPTFIREYRKLAARCSAARFPAVKSLDTLDFRAIPSVNKALVMELAHCEYIQGRENVIAIDKTHVALGLGLTACQRGMSVGLPPRWYTLSPPLNNRSRRLLEFGVARCPYFLSFASMRCARSMR